MYYLSVLFAPPLLLAPRPPDRPPLLHPRSGPFRYDYNGGAWVYRRDGHALHAKLEAELEALTGIAVDLNPCTGCERLGTCVEADRCEKPEGAAGT
jgi:hypothetical protein